MRLWWRRRSLRLRLPLWFAGRAVFILLAFGAALWLILQQRLEAELDRQLRIDFDGVAHQLEREADGALRWNTRGSHGDDGVLRAAIWFEVWSTSGKLLLRRWPTVEARWARPAGAGGTPSALLFDGGGSAPAPAHHGAALSRRSESDDGAPDPRRDRDAPDAR